jgi:hypothetical protein
MGERIRNTNIRHGFYQFTTWEPIMRVSFLMNGKSSLLSLVCCKSVKTIQNPLLEISFSCDRWFSCYCFHEFDKGFS